MKTYKQCLSCFERQVADVCAMSQLGAAESEAILDVVRGKIETFSLDCPPIRMAIEIHDLIRTESGIADPYAKIKKISNEVCSDCSVLWEDRVSISKNPLETAVKIAIAGNIIDCGAYGLRKVSRSDLVNVVQDVLLRPLEGDDVKSFQDLVNNAKSILYIGDNAGEVFFDKPLLNLLPVEKVIYAVRGGPVLNDATIEDARIAGIDDICRLIDTGDNAPGVLLERCSDEFTSIFKNSDLVISKGQGNYESLSEMSDKTIVFLTKVKCEIIAEDIGFQLNSNVIKISRSISRPSDSLLHHKQIIQAMLQRRSCTRDEISSSTGIQLNEVLKHLRNLEQAGQVRFEYLNGIAYYRGTPNVEYEHANV